MNIDGFLGSLNLPDVYEPQTTVATTVPPATTGISVSDITNVLAGASPVALVADVLGLDKVIGNTIGAVIANGFNFSCWGSTFTPQDATKWAQIDFPKIYNLTIGKGLTTPNVQAFADILSWNYTQGIHFGNKMNDCSKKTLHGYANASIKYRDEVLNQLGDKISILGEETTKRSYATLFVTAQKNFDTYDKEYVTKKVVAKSSSAVLPPKEQVTQAQNNAILETVTTPYGSNTGIVPKSETTNPTSDYSMQDLPNEPKTKEGGSFPWWLALIFMI